MLSRKAVCLWIFLALPLVALVVSGVSLGQAVNDAPSRPARPRVDMTRPAEQRKGREIEEILKALNAGKARAEVQLKEAEARLKEVHAQLQKAISRYETVRTLKAPNIELRMVPGAFGRRRVRYELTREHDPQMAKLLEQDSTLDKEARGLAEQCREETDKEKRAELKTRLTELTEKHFELRQERRQLQIAQLEAELEKVRATIDKRNDASELIIRRRVSRLLGEKDELDWGPSAASPLRIR